MSEVKNKLELTVTDQQIKDLLCGAFEGTSGFNWYYIKRYNYPEGQTEESLGLEYPHLDLPFVEGGSLTIVDVEGGGQPEYTLDKEACIKGLNIMTEKFTQHFADFISENYDAITSDVFLQCAVLGDVIYG